jgi:hypothetical protein
MGYLRMGLVLVGVVAFALFPAGALGARGADHVHTHDVGTDVDTNFCGTGETVDIAFDIVNQLTIGPGEFFEATGSGKVWFTSRTTGLTVINSFAGQFTDETISGDPAGIHTHRFTNKGLPEKLQTYHGPVLLRDAGIVVFEDTFDGDTLLSSAVTIVKGPHPELDSDFTLFCQVMTEALGID